MRLWKKRFLRRRAEIFFGNFKKMYATVQVREGGTFFV